MTKQNAPLDPSLALYKKTKNCLQTPHSSWTATPPPCVGMRLMPIGNDGRVCGWSSTFVLLTDQHSQVSSLRAVIQSQLSKLKLCAGWQEATCRFHSAQHRRWTTQPNIQMMPSSKYRLGDRSLRKDGNFSGWFVSTLVDFYWTRFCRYGSTERRILSPWTNSTLALTLKHSHPNVFNPILYCKLVSYGKMLDYFLIACLIKQNKLIGLCSSE